jgi:hypothetical protein
VQPTKAEIEAIPLDPSKFGLVCPKDPNRKSTDPKAPPTHLSADVAKLDMDERPAFTAAEIAAGKKRHPTTAHLVCNTCGNEWTVTPWPPRG